MKKIVAIVLSLVMVLGLATTAFAASAGASVAGAQYNFDWNVTVALEDGEDAKDSTFATYTIEAVAAKDDVQAFWATLTNVEKGDKEDVEINGEDEFVKVASEELADVVIVDSTTITYYATADKYEDGFVGKATKVTLPVYPLDDADVECNTLYAASLAESTYYYFENTLWVYAADAADVLNVDGVAVPAAKIVDLKDNNNNAGIVYVAHDFQIEEGYMNHTNLNGGSKWGVTKVYCDNCKASFKFEETASVAKAIATFGQANYEFVTNNGATVAIELVVPSIPGVSAGSSTGAADGETVESAKTFDAGIAMYVGMSVMAAAGSAVVLKKKD